MQGKGKQPNPAGRCVLLLLLAGLLAVCVSCFPMFLDRAERIIFGVKPGVTLAGEPLCGLLPAEVWRHVAGVAVELYRPPRNAAVDRATGQIIPEADGRRVLVGATAERVLTAKKGEAVDLVTEVIKAPYDRQLLAELTEHIGAYSTAIAGSENRLFNIRLAAQSINNTLVYPGEIFSFNRTVGPRTRERGYKEAPVIIGGAMALDEGGGICQVSSTLYNAVLRAKLEVVERHPHSRPVHYVPAGRDAAVAYNHFDLQWRNNYLTPVLLRASVGGRVIYISIIGHRPAFE